MANSAKPASTGHNANERRSFFRVASELALSFHSVDAYTADEGLIEAEFPEDSGSLTLLSELKRIDNEANSLLIQIAEQSRATADYLGLMNKKLDLINHQLLAEQYLDSSVTPSKVNISEGGLAFKSSKPLYKGSHLALRLLFTQGLTVIATFAKVIRCDASTNGTSTNKGGDNNQYNIAVKFHRLSSTQQQLLSKHIMQAQLKEKRTRQ